MTDAPKKPIRVCFISPKAYPIFNPAVGDYFGGACVDLYYLATELARDERFEASFVVADYGQADGEVIEGVKVFKALDFKRGVLSGMVRTWQALKRANADIYVMKCAGPGVPLVAMFCRLYHRVFVYRLASLLESDGTYVKQHPFSGWTFVWSLRQARMVFAQNVVDAENLSRTFGLNACVIPNGHRLGTIVQSRRDAILWVGRDEPIKRPERFLALARAVPDEQFTMICQTRNNDRNYVQLVADSAKIPNLKFIKHVPFSRVDEYFQQAKVFVNTSDAEGFPNTFIQAGRAGTAILSFAVNPDGFLDKYNCGACVNADWPKMIDTLKTMLLNNNYATLGLTARKYVEEKHDIQKVIALYKHIFADWTK